MSKNNFTPGPWKVYYRKEWSKENGNGGEGFSRMLWIGHGETDWRGPGTIVDNVKPWSSIVDENRTFHKEAEANAHLIAAAPEMLSVLEYTQSLLVELDIRDEVLEQKIANAIAKARGEIK